MFSRSFDTKTDRHYTFNVVDFNELENFRYNDNATSLVAVVGNISDAENFRVRLR